MKFTLLTLLACLLLSLSLSEPIFEALNYDDETIGVIDVEAEQPQDVINVEEDLGLKIDTLLEEEPVVSNEIPLDKEDEIINTETDVNTDKKEETVVEVVVVAEEDKKEVKQPFFVELYEAGKRAYLANDFKNCAANIEEALKSYEQYSHAILKCKVKCYQEAEEKFVPLSAEDIDNLHFFEKMVKQTLCLMNCKNATMPELSAQLPKEVLDDFERKMPYDYLQLCYYNLKDFFPAANAAFTYHVHNPDSEIMRDNMAWYTNKLNSSEFANREPFLHTSTYKAGVYYYSEGEWEKSVQYFEKAASDFITAEQECRLECEKPFDMGWFPDFVTAVANHFVFCLKCKQQCQTKLSNLDGNIIEDVFPLMYNYLQFSYYKLGEIRNAVECVETFLLIEPNDTNMVSNKLYYQTQEKADISWFKARPEVEKYLLRDRYEKDILSFIYTQFAYYNKNGDDGPKLQNKDDLKAFKNQEPKTKGDLSLLDSTTDF